MAPGLRKPQKLARHVPEESGIEDEYRLDCQARSPIEAKFQPEDAALQRVDVLQFRELGEMQKRPGERAQIDAGRARPAHDDFEMRGRVIDLPGKAINLLPFPLAHRGMRRHDMLGIVFVHVTVHRHPLAMKGLMILRPRQRCQAEEFHHVDRQLALDDADVAPDRFRRVIREAQDVTRIGDGAHSLPGEQQLAVFGDLVLPLLGRNQRIGIYAFDPDEDASHARLRAFFDEVWDLVAQRVDLDHQADANALLHAQLDDAVEDRFPISVAGEVVVGNEEAVNAFRPVLADNEFDVVRRAPPRFPSLHVDDGTERALVRTAAPGIECRVFTCRALDVRTQQEGHRRRLDRGKVVEIIVDGLQRHFRRVAQQRIQPLLRLAREQADPQVESLLKIGLHPGQHRKTSRNVKPADDDGDSGGTQRTRDVHGAGKLVRLDAHQADQAETAMAFQLGNDPLWPDPGIGLVDRRHVDGDVGPEYLAPGGVDRESVKRGQRVRWHDRAEPLDHVAVVVVM